MYFVQSTMYFVHNKPGKNKKDLFFQGCHNEFIIENFEKFFLRRARVYVLTSVILILWRSYLTQHFFESTTTQSSTCLYKLVTLWSSKISRHEASFDIFTMTTNFQICSLWSQKNTCHLEYTLSTSYQIFVVSIFEKKKLYIVEARSMSFADKNAKKTQIV